MSASLQFESSPIYISSSTSEMSQMVCGHSGTFLLTWPQRVVRRCSQLRKHLNIKVLLVIGLGIRSSSCEGVDHDALWLALLAQVCQLAAHALNCSESDCDGAECIETVVGQVCERV